MCSRSRVGGVHRPHLLERACVHLLFGSRVRVDGLVLGCGVHFVSSMAAARELFELVSYASPERGLVRGCGICILSHWAQGAKGE